jgi:hypothetical protein
VVLAIIRANFDFLHDIPDDRLAFLADGGFILPSTWRYLAHHPPEKVQVRVRWTAEERKLAKKQVIAGKHNFRSKVYRPSTRLMHRKPPLCHRMLAGGAAIHRDTSHSSHELCDRLRDSRRRMPARIDSFYACTRKSEGLTNMNKGLYDTSVAFYLYL